LESVVNTSQVPGNWADDADAVDAINLASGGADALFEMNESEWAQILLDRLDGDQAVQFVSQLSQQVAVGGVKLLRLRDAVATAMADRQAVDRLLEDEPRR
jgi:hypothetical protein